MVWYLKLFKYIEPIWLGNSGKPSIRRVLALAFSYNLATNITETLSNPKLMNSYAEVAMLLGIEAGLIAALMSLTTYTTALASKKNSSTSIETD